MTSFLGRLFGKQQPPTPAPIAPTPPAQPVAPIIDTAPIFEPTPGNPLPNYTRPFTDEKLPRPTWGEPIPRRYPNWRELGYADELDAAHWEHYRQRHWLEYEKKLAKTKAGLGDEWQEFIDTLVAVSDTWDELTLDSVQKNAGVSRVKARKLIDLMVTWGWAQPQSRGQVSRQVGPAQVPQLRAWQAGKQDEPY